MKVYLKFLEDEKEDIKTLKKAIKNLDIQLIDNIKSKLLKKQFNIFIDEKELPKEFRNYIISYTDLKDTNCERLNNFFKKAKEEKKDILIIWGENGNY